MDNNKIYSMAHRKEVTITCGPDTRNTVTSPYINWWDTDIGSYKGHKGLDTNGAKMGDTIYALVGGVAHVGRNAAAGNYVYTNDDGLYVEYLHLSKQLVSNGQRIVPGQAVGLQGNTGNVTGPHLHISVKVNGALVDPTLYQLGIKPDAPAVAMTGKVADNYVRLRLSCSTDGVILGQYNKGTAVEIYREVNGWYLLKVCGKYGYIRKDLVMLDSADKPVQVGSVVKVRQGAKAYNGASIASYVYGNTYRVDELKGDRAVLDLKGLCTAFRVSDLIVQ